MNDRPSRLLLACFAATIFVGAFLVFQVQPVISKTILPWFGGSPAVWTTCMLFFQVLLFGGYVYAHLLTTYLRPRWQGAVHAGLIFGTLLVLPLAPDPSWKPVDSANPTWRIFALLAVNVGLPYFLLATTGPLIQAWFSHACPGRSPYRLYSLSNVGSLAALLSYPLLFEPLLTTGDQARWWSLGFCAFALVCGLVAIRLWQPGAGRESVSPMVAAADPPVHTSTARTTQTPIGDNAPPAWSARIAWLALPAFACVMLLATTNHVCQDVAVIPFLWVAPLSLYLLSFILTFDSPRWYVRWWYAAGAVLSIATASLMTLINATEHLLLEIAVYFAAMFCVAMLCHGELVRRKPSPRYLTSFYLMCSAGGAVGGVFVAIVCPLMFSKFVEMHLSLLAGFVMAAAILVRELKPALSQRAAWSWGVLGATGICLLLVAKAQGHAALSRRHVAMRNFYGVIYVDESDRDDPARHGWVTFHGRIAHGFQYAAPEKRRAPTMYFDEHSGAGVALTRFPRGADGQQPLRVGIIGLGAGTLAVYAQPGDHYTFFEINPAVVEMARRHFTFLADSPATVDVVLGDARLTMDRQPSHHFDVLILDAFSGDAIPTHLLTREAFDIYQRLLKPHGVIAAHISNRHVDLTPVLANLAEHYRYSLREVKTKTDPDRAVTASHWVLLSDNAKFLGDPVTASMATPLPPQAAAKHRQVPMWTDQYSNLLSLLR